MPGYFHRKCNRWDSCRQIPLVKKREEQLEENGRQKRRYEKKGNAYWLDGGKRTVARKVGNKMEEA